MNLSTLQSAQCSRYRRKPTKTYCGLTIVLSSPSRFDDKALLSGYAGSFFIDCLSPIYLSSCDLRLAADSTPLIDGTKVVLCLGASAAHAHIPLEHTLNEMRGCPFVKDGIIYIPSYFPQDAMDMKASYEKDYNKNLETADVESEDSYDETDTNEKSTKGNTARANYKFWLEQDVKKAKQLLQLGVNEIINQQSYAQFEIFPPLAEAINELEAAALDLYLDIETDSCLNITCIGFATTESLPKIYCVPVKRFNGTIAYDRMGLFFGALSRAMQRCCCVIHNSSYDLLVLSGFFNCGFGRKQYDTMLAAHRLNVEAEMSLGHCVSLYTLLPYHKSEGVFEPQNERQEEQLWRYNAKDIACLPIIKRNQLELAKLKRCEESIAQVNSSIYPYMIATLMGIRLNAPLIEKKLAINDAWMTQYLRIIELMIGHPLLPTSSKACIQYFHHELGLPVIKRNNKTGAPSLDEKSLWKLAAKQDHPIIPLVLEYRRLKKESGTLAARPWRSGDDVKLTPDIKQQYVDMIYA